MNSRVIGDFAIAVSLAILAAIVIHARRSQAARQDRSDSGFGEEISAEPTPDEIRAAKISIRVKTDEAVLRAQRGLKEWSLLLLAALVTAALFMECQCKLTFVPGDSYYWLYPRHSLACF
jgi:hypothetical protein